MNMRLVLVTLIVAMVPVLAQKRPIQPDDLLSLHRVSDPQLSPDGKSVAYVITQTHREKNSRNSDIWILPLSGGASRQLTNSEKADDSPRWSPDGRQIAFVSGREAGSQIWLLDPSTGNVRRVTDISTGASGPVWSPDGKYLAFASEVYPDCSDDSCNQRRSEEATSGVVRARIIDRLLYRHWNFWEDGRRSHLFLLPMAGGPLKDLTPGDFDTPPFSLGGAVDYAFSPDGNEICFARNVEVLAAASTNSDLWTLPLAGGPTLKITDNPGADHTPRYSPDGRFVAYRSQLRAGFEADRWRLMLYERKSGKHLALAVDLDRSVDDLAWSPDSRTILFIAGDEGYSPVFSVPANGGKVARLVDKSSNGDIQISSDGKSLLFSRQSLTQPTEIFSSLVDGSGVRQISTTNQALLESLDLNKPEVVWWTGEGGTRIHGWLIKPPQFDPSRKYPFILLIHGGPQGVWGDSFSYRWNPQVFSGHGYVVLAANPRGSTTFGQKFTDEISGDWGGRAFEDLMKGVDYVAGLGFIDKSRMGAAGASYGGYMVNWILGHSDRFKALVSHDGVYNLASMYGATEELWFPEWEFMGTPWSNPQMYERWSPHLSAAKFKTPTLIIHGELDFRVPIGEGLQLFTALQRQGVASRLLYFPDEGHWVLKPQNSLLWHKTVFEWLDRYLK